MSKPCSSHASSLSDIASDNHVSVKASTSQEVVSTSDFIWSIFGTTLRMLVYKIDIYDLVEFGWSRLLCDKADAQDAVGYISSFTVLDSAS